ncbi:site-specific integrase [Vibrio alginolyticus]|uniref:site-specific integrase n=2 Tax=Vibrio TaxID=662 RepID=UPI0004132BB6|nr:site-specific integrase [Vibrio parahaemolyticus]
MYINSVYYNFIAYIHSEVYKFMLSIQQVSNGKHSHWVMFDTNTCMPTLYPTMYYISELATRAPETQKKTLYALTYFYKFWERKYGMSFCHYLLRNNYDLAEPIVELDNFFEFLCSNQHLHDNPIDGATHYLDLASGSAKKTNAGRVRTAIRFLKYLSRTYATVKYLDISVSDCKKLRSQYEQDLISISKRLNLIEKSSESRDRKPLYQSIPKAMRQAIMVITIPSTPNKPNSRNPFSSTYLQIRNDLLIRLYFYYGLRAAEVLLLDTRSYKMSAPDPRGVVSYSLVVTNREEGVIDKRTRQPSIKTRHSHRIVSLSKRDYLHLKGFTEQYRNQHFSDGIHHDHGYIFTSSVAPFNPLSYETVRDIFQALDSSLTKHFPLFRDTELYINLPKLTPKVARHTWAYEQLNHLYTSERRKAIEVAASTGQVLNNKEIMANAVNTLRSQGGWSENSKMPMRYARRFFDEQGNFQNLDRIDTDSFEIQRSFEAHLDTEETETTFYEFK